MGTTAGEALESHMSSLDGVVAARFNEQLVDLSCQLESDGTLEPVTAESGDGLDVYWHTTSHVMAQAILRLYPGTKYAMGPSIAQGFYYDFDKPEPFVQDDLEAITKEMRKIIKENLPVTREEISREEAMSLFQDLNQDYKVELVKEMPPGEIISIYRQGDFVDLCRGPHLSRTGQIEAFELLSIAGAHWLGEEGNPMLQRIYGISYPSQDLMDQYLKRMEEAQKRDHRKLGPALDIFDMYPEAGAGLVFWLPGGGILWEEIEKYWKEEHQKAGYQLVRTPHIAKAELWQTSGHYDYFKDEMYVFSIGEREFAIKPMNCPGHILIYKSRIRSYRELPVRLAEIGTVYRNEKDGNLHGTLRVRSINQDDAHIFCTPEQLEDEVIGVIDLTRKMLATFGFENYKIELSVWDPEESEHFAGESEQWDQAEAALRGALERAGLEFERHVGEAAFYGPKIDVHVADAIGRYWQCSTIQFDFNLPARFDITYVDDKGEKRHPYVVHRVVLGAIERFVGVLIEHYAGSLPAWLCPTQAVVVPITQDNLDYASRVHAALTASGIRAKLDDSTERMAHKIRDAELMKVPAIYVVGKKEEESKTVSVRVRGRGDQGMADLDEAVGRLKREIDTKSIDKI
jgi:threonyl-tRNA synthetase